MKKKFDFNFKRSKNELNEYLQKPSSKDFKEEFKSTNESFTTVYIGNLNYRRDENGIKKLFSPFGKVKSVQIVMREGTELKSGIAFVQMYNQNQAEAAISSLNGKIVDERTLKVSLANSRF